MTTPPPHTIPRLPSRKVGAILTAAMLATGIAIGALIGPGRAGSISSLASGARAAALGRVLVLLALGSGTSSGSEPLLSSTASLPSLGSSQPTPSPTSDASAGGGGAIKSASSAKSGSTAASPRSSSGSAPASPTHSAAPAKGSEEAGEKPKTPLPPIADAWLIELPYGTSLEDALRQSAAAPYLDGQLKSAGTVLSAYSSVAAGQLAGAATLLSGQVGANVTTLAPPPCASSAGIPASGSPTASGTGASTGTASAPCPSGEPAGLQATDSFLREVVPKIEASSSYREHGLIVITFVGASGPQGASPSSVATSNAGEGPIAYPPGSVTSTLSAAGAPTGALLLSPFLSHVGARSTGPFNPLAPHESLERLLRAKPTG